MNGQDSCGRKLCLFIFESIAVEGIMKNRSHLAGLKSVWKMFVEVGVVDGRGGGSNTERGTTVKRWTIWLQSRDTR